MNINDPESRFAYLEANGIEAFRAEVDRQLRESVVATVNGVWIRRVETRWGILFHVDGTKSAYPSLPQAIANAAGMDEERLHETARQFMDRFGYGDMSLDEYLAAFGDRLDEAQRFEGYSILAAFDCVRPAI